MEPTECLWSLPGLIRSQDYKAQLKNPIAALASQSGPDALTMFETMKTLGQFSSPILILFFIHGYFAFMHV